MRERSDPMGRDLSERAIDQCSQTLAYSIFETIRSDKSISSRISPDNVLAMCLVVTGEARSHRAAAIMLDLNPQTVSQFAAKERGKNIKHLAQVEFLNSAPSKAYQRIVQIALNGKSDGVSMRASERVRDEAGFKPTEKRQIEHSGTVQHVIPTVIMDPRQLSDDQRAALFGAQEDQMNPVIEGQATEIEEENE